MENLVTEASVTVIEPAVNPNSETLSALQSREQKFAEKKIKKWGRTKGKFEIEVSLGRRIFAQTDLFLRLPVSFWIINETEFNVSLCAI